MLTVPTVGLPMPSSRVGFRKETGVEVSVGTNTTGDIVDIEAAQGVIAAEVEPAERRYDLSAEAALIGPQQAHGDHVAVVIVGPEVLGFHDFRNRVHVAAERAALERRGKEDALPVRGVYRIIYSVIT